MGCCASSESSPYQEQPNSSSRAITSSQPPSHAHIPRPSTHTSNHSGSHRHHQQQDLTSHINKRLKLHVWSSKNKIWTNVALDKERIDFFETRVTGRQEVWQTIHGALEVLWSGGDAGETDGGLSTAQTILDAADITVPTGDMAQGVYDNFGAFYQLAEHIVSNPTNLAVVGPRADEDKDAGEGSEDPDEEEVLRRREEKGKRVVRPQDLIDVKIRLSDREAPLMKISIGKECSIAKLAERIKEELHLPDTKHIKIAYLGRILKPNKSLLEQGWHDDYVVNGLVLEKLSE